MEPKKPREQGFFRSQICVCLGLSQKTDFADLQLLHRTYRPHRTMTGAQDQLCFSFSTLISLLTFTSAAACQSLPQWKQHVCSLLYDIPQPLTYLPNTITCVKKTVLFLALERNLAPAYLHYFQKPCSPETAWNRLKNSRAWKFSIQPYLCSFGQTWSLNHNLPHFNIIFSCITNMSTVHGKIKFRTSGITSFCYVFRQCNSSDHRNYFY